MFLNAKAESPHVLHGGLVCRVCEASDRQVSACVARCAGHLRRATAWLVPRVRFELTTPRFSVECSTKLSYLGTAGKFIFVADGVLPAAWESLMVGGESLELPTSSV